MKVLGLLLALRFLGLFIVLPVLSIYALHLNGANEFTAGIAVGAYALSQLIFQIPFGRLGDKFDKKTLLIVGFILLGLGSLVCAFADNIYTLIFGRILQGAGAIGGVILAYIAEVVNEEERAKSFAFVGQFIALSFAISMVAGPLIGGKFGIDKLFLFTFLLSVIAIIMVVTIVPPAPKIEHFSEPPKFGELLKNRDLQKLFFTGFMQKGLMTTFFMLVPILFTQKLGWSKTDLWKIYVPALIVGIGALPLGAILAEKKGKVKEVFIIGATSMTGAIWLFALQKSWAMFLAVILFFFGFNLIEPVLQSFVSKVVKANQKATALSTSNTIQYLGIFLGGAVAGFFLNKGMLEAFLIFAGIVGLIWIWLMAQFKPLMKLKVVEYEKFDPDFIESLKTNPKVYDFYQKDGVLFVRYREE
ncbi:MAG: MFS transporter [Epsilonproteobacteria bacterium]|jgi:predicted MFS family arabinose efflux permease|nr:MFS transporter [Campylobacterota bacterium]NPA88744.1 MFS transporter [Campylobacterota bacterium]